MVWIEFRICFFNKLISVFVHHAHDHVEELKVLDFSIMVDVKGLEQILSVLRMNVDLVILNGFLELIEVEGTVVVGVKDLELSSKPDEPSASTILKLFLEPFDQDHLALRSLALGVLMLHVVHGLVSISRTRQGTRAVN